MFALHVDPAHRTSQISNNPAYVGRTRETFEMVRKRVPALKPKQIDRTNRRKRGTARLITTRCDCESEDCHPKADCQNFGIVKTIHSTVCITCAEKMPAKYLFRRDVIEFASMMSAAMDSKAIERDSRNDPHYMDQSYDLAQAILALCDKTDQLAYDAAVRPENVDQVRKTAVHLANFCMIIQRKANAGHHPGSVFNKLPAGFASSTAARLDRSHDAELKRISTELECAPVVEEIIRRIRKLKERQA